MAVDSPGAADRPGAEPLQPIDPRTLGRYRIEARLGTGTAGTAYLAREPGGGPVAITVLHVHLLADQESRARFADEVALADRVAPFCTVPVLDSGEDGDTYLVTEYVEGPTLEQVLSGQGPLDPEALATVAAGTATALTAIHAAGLTHRAFGPAAVILSATGVRVTGFGPAHPHGTPRAAGGWLAPELRDHAERSPAADVYDWGCLVAYAGTGRHPFVGPDQDAAPGSTPDLDGLPESVRGLVAAALADDPRDRPTAQDLLNALGDASAPVTRRSRVALTAEVPAPPPSPASPAGRRSRRGLIVLASLVTTAIAVAAVAAVFQPWQHHGPDTAGPPGTRATSGPSQGGATPGSSAGISSSSPHAGAFGSHSAAPNHASSTATPTGPAPTSPAGSTTQPTQPPPVTTPPVLPTFPTERPTRTCDPRGPGHHRCH